MPSPPKFAPSSVRLNLQPASHSTQPTISTGRTRRTPSSSAPGGRDPRPLLMRHGASTKSNFPSWWGMSDDAGPDGSLPTVGRLCWPRGSTPQPFPNSTSSSACSPVSSSMCGAMVLRSPMRPLSLGCTWHEGAPTGSSRRAPRSAAWAIKGESVRPELDPTGVCGLAYTTHRVGERTGFAGVRSLPIGTHVELRARSAMKFVHRPPPWMPGSELESKHGTELVDLARMALEEELEANVDFPVRLLLTDLTGGKDTRLVLALALTAGVADQLLFRTQGPATIRDVILARACRAGRRSLDRQRRLPCLPPRPPR